MHLFPAIDLIDGQAVRLIRGDYAQKTVYSDTPLLVAKHFREAGAEFLHVVDLDGAKDGTTVNREVIRTLIEESGLKVEVGGGIRTGEVVDQYIQYGAYRVILGTAAVKDNDFLTAMVNRYGEKIAVGVDLRDGLVAIRGWQEVSSLDCFAFCEHLQKIGVKTVICTDISKDGLLSGTNLTLYRQLCTQFNMDIVASGGVSSVADIEALAALRLSGAILGKALYTGNLDLKQALAAANSAQ